MNRTAQARFLCSALAVTLALGSLVLAWAHMSHSVWYDESQTNLIASQPTAGRIVKDARTVRSYPPFFFFAVHESLQLRSDERGLRLPAAVFGALAVFAVFLLGRKLSGDLAGLAAACLFLFTPGVFRYFVDGNAYTLLMLASALSTLCLLRATSTNRVKDWLLYGLFALLGLGTHILFVFHLGAQFLTGLYQLRGGRAYWRLLVTTTLLVIPTVLFHILYLSGGGDVRPLVLSRALRTQTLVTLAGMYLGPLSLGSLTLLALWCPLQALGAITFYRKDRRTFWTLAILIAVPVAAITLFIGSTLKYVAYRYAIGVFPLACVVAAASFNALAARTRLWRVSIGVVTLAYCAAGAAFIAQAGPEGFGYQDWRSAAGTLRRFAAADDKVLVAPSSGLLPLQYYYNTPRMTASSVDQAAEVVQRSLREPARRAATVWVVFSTFANESPLAAKYTEFGDSTPEAQVKSLVSDVEARGLAVCRTDRLHRVTVLTVQSERCLP